MIRVCSTKPFLHLRLCDLPNALSFITLRSTGSWLDIAEIELAALSKQCLGKRRIDNLETLNSEIAKWQQDRNEGQKSVDWQFTAENARIKLKQLYPIVNF